MSALRTRMIEDMQLAGLSAKVLTLTLSVTWRQSSSCASPFAPAAPRADEPLLPVEDRDIRSISLRHLRSAGNRQG